jgi:hypothetical protein
VLAVRDEPAVEEGDRASGNVFRRDGCAVCLPAGYTRARRAAWEAAPFSIVLEARP